MASTRERRRRLGLAAIGTFVVTVALCAGTQPAAQTRISSLNAQPAVGRSGYPSRAASASAWLSGSPGASILVSWR